MRCVARAILALSTAPSGFSASQVAEHVRAQDTTGNSIYGARQAAYDLQKFQCKGLVYRSGKRRRYSTNSENLRAISALLVIRDRLLIPLLAAAANKQSESCANREIQPADQLYLEARSTMYRLLQHLGVAA